MFIVGAFMTDIRIDHIFLALVFVILTAMLFAFLGLYNALFAKSFDDISLIPTFLITPMTYLGGVFYPISSLGQPWQFLSQFNPILYMVNGLRYSFISVSDINIWISFGILVVCNL